MKLTFSPISLLAAAPAVLASKIKIGDKFEFETARDLIGSGPPCYTFDKDTILYEDITCDCDGFANPPSAVVEVVGPAYLNLNGHTVKCTSGYTTEGTIVASGSGARIANGYVYGSSGDRGDCIYLNDDGHHGVKNVVVDTCRRHCIASAEGTSNNKIVKNTVSYCLSTGIWAAGHGDLVKFNSVYHVELGIVAYHDFIRVQSNFVGYAAAGIVAIMYGEKIFYNVVADGFTGIFVGDTATYGDIRGNKISRVSTGMDLDGSYNMIWYNTFFHNFDGIIVNPPAAGNEIKKNIAYDNEKYDYFDSTNCGTNTWYANKGNLTDTCP